MTKEEKLEIINKLIEELKESLGYNEQVETTSSSEPVNALEIGWVSSHNC